MNRRVLLRKIASGALRNVAFRDMLGLLEGLGFSLRRVTGSHHIFVHAKILEPVTFNGYAEKRSPTRFDRCCCWLSASI
jgi:predicted RNA binding protein YcfA (HicA-like mRNA interferase family)